MTAQKEQVGSGSSQEEQHDPSSSASALPEVPTSFAPTTAATTAATTDTMTSAPASTSRSASVSTSAPLHLTLASELSLFSADVSASLHGDAAAEQRVQAALLGIPQAHRAAYTRAQSKVRQAFHAHTAFARRRRLSQLLLDTHADPLLDGDKRARLTRWRAFVQQFAQRHQVGTHPWFAAIATVMRLQTVAHHHRGAGNVCLEWELDDAVLMEAGGDEFTEAAVVALKSTLGWSEVGPHLRSNGTVTATTEVDDPFSDPDPASSISPLTRAWIVSPHLDNPELKALAKCVPKHVFSSRKLRQQVCDFEVAEETVPARPPPPPSARWPASSSGTTETKAEETDVEAQMAHARRMKSIKLSTGCVRRSVQRRSKGWRGTWWAKLVLWFRALLRLT